MLLLSDGTVMAANAGGSAWYRLTPEQLRAWAAGSSPTVNVGTITVVLDAVGKQRLRAASQGTRPAIE